MQSAQMVAGQPDRPGENAGPGMGVKFVVTRNGPTRGSFQYETNKIIVALRRKMRNSQAFYNVQPGTINFFFWD